MVYIYGTKDWQETEALTQAYAACIRTCIIQQRGLGGFAETTTWEGEEYLEGEHSSGRTTGVAHIRFTVNVPNAMNIFGGPPTAEFAPTDAITGPSTDSPTATPTVETVDIQVSREQI
jgi:hypothetical protein